LQDFTEETNIGLLKTLEEGDYEGLVSVMRHLLNVRQRQPEYDNLFDPLLEILHLLKVYDVDIPDDVHTLMKV
jgi:dynein heavy chain